MERQLPKNVRQIGNVSDTPKIYVEDYVDTFLNQICEKVDQLPLGAFLIGETAKDEEEEYIYIYGAVQMHNLQFVNKEYVISEDAWKNAYEDCKQYFEDGEMLGWFVTSPGETTALSHNLSKLHKTSFPKKNSLLIVKEPFEKEEMYYVHKFNELLPINGHYTYYEKNPCMQNYMISCRKKNGVTPSETIADRAATDFRSLTKTREELKNQKRTSHLVYAGGGVLIFILIIMGVATITNFGKMNSVQNTLANVGGAVEQTGSGVERQSEEQTQSEKAIDEQASKESGVLDAAQQNSEEDTGESLSQENVSDNGTSSNIENGNAEDSSSEDSNATMEASSANITNDASASPQTIGQEEVAQGSQEEDIYIVKKGDTLASISEKIYGDADHVDNICNMNGLTDSNLIYIGQKLLIP